MKSPGKCLPVEPKIVNPQKKKKERMRVELVSSSLKKPICRVYYVGKKAMYPVNGKCRCSWAYEGYK